MPPPQTPFFIVFLCFLNACSSVFATQFDFGTLTMSTLKLLGIAPFETTTPSASPVTPPSQLAAGRALYSDPIRFRQTKGPLLWERSPFLLLFVTNLNPSSVGGGLAFVVSPDSTAVGDSGGFLGLQNPAAATGGGGGFVAVEFDTLMDVEFSDINGNHVGLDLNSVVSAQVSDLGSVGVDLKSGDSVNAWIEYDGSSKGLRVWVSYSTVRPKDPILKVDLDV
ncbi:L-type lectin-domain containing receptor kinase VIII.2-like, partial [Vigna umbellata]|uniref:L-type lectin-domain containing receptor kinase VIII.2-like n=1 Tax=Vigna umbellata TaxID=87088 RepID=UPI001F5E3895